MKNVERDVVLNGLRKELNWNERIIVSVFKKTFAKVYGISGKRVFNNFYSK